jgi:hypothetical protein
VPTPNRDLGIDHDPGSEDEGDRFIGWSAVEEAARVGHLNILKRLGPDPARDDFDELYQYARYESIVAFLAAIQPPKDLTSILSWHLRWMVDPYPLSSGRGSGMVEKLLTCGVRWAETDPGKISDVRRWLMKAKDYELKNTLRHLKRPESCAPQTLEELVRSSKIRERLYALGVLKKPVSERERRRDELRRLMYRYDRTVLYKQVWSQPVQDVAKSYGISGVALAKACRKLEVPVPPRGYWARIRNGYKARKPSLPRLSVTEPGNERRSP